MKYVDNKTFHNINYTDTAGEAVEYENCVFQNCDFSNADISGCLFSDCQFMDCNLSLAKIDKTAFQTVTFKNCKMLGLRFDSCNQFGLALSFQDCHLNHSSFFKLKLKKTTFNNCQLQETDFVESTLTGALFSNCDLMGAMIENANLEKADFRTAYNFDINPDLNKIKKTRFSLNGLPGLLSKYDIIIDK